MADEVHRNDRYRTRNGQAADVGQTELFDPEATSWLPQDQLAYYAAESWLAAIDLECLPNDAFPRSTSAAITLEGVPLRALRVRHGELGGELICRSTSSPRILTQS
jgi:hypothetical protein